MKDVATLPKQRKDIDDICNACEYIENCVVAYTNAAYECEVDK